jgi:hypothetical protein
MVAIVALTRNLVAGLWAFPLLVVLAGCGGAVSREGTYSGPNEAMIVVTNDVVTKVRLRYAGNTGFTVASALISVEGTWMIEGDAFTVPTAGPTLRGTFVDGNHKISGTWQEGPVKGTWSAHKD